ncbi:MAG: D-alanyl-D-alanine carboxypeptidase, partial [Cellulomonadaceae bacterium]|nr:D-alanyl-D-alanine carboxypeptidase [Cellulomonadaceae bacterium]
MKQSGKITVAVAAFALLLGGYLTADAHDVVPGLVTLAPPYVQPAPFPVPPGAMPGPVPAYTLSDLPSDAPIPSPDDVEPLVASLVADARMGPHSGVLVVDALTGETLGSNLATTGFTPASTQKILTGAAALTVLDPEATLPTTVMLSGSGDLYLVGGGDMMLAAGEGNPDLVNGRAGLADLAEQAAGQVTVTGQTSVRLFVDDTLFEGPTISAAVPPGEQNRFVAAASSLAVGIASSTAPTDQSTPRVPDPAMHAAQAFARALADRGVQVTGQITRAATPSTAREIGAVHSAPIIDVTEHAMAISENTITEVLGRLVAIEKGMPGSLEASLTAVKQSMTALDVDMTGATLVDLSGLGRGSALPPTHLV